MPTFDSPWKDVLYHHLRLVLLLLFPRLAKRIDWTTDHEPLEQELRRIVPEAEVGVRFADAMIKVRMRSRDDRILHAEVQAQKQDDFGRRVFGYNYRGYDRFTTHPESLIILGDNDPEWKPKSYKVKLEYTTLTFTFRPAKLLEFLERREALLTSDNPMGLFVLAHLEAMRTAGKVKEAAAAKLALLRNLATRKLDAENKRQWSRYLDYFFSDLPAEVSYGIDQELARLMGEDNMSFDNYVTTWERRGRQQGEIDGKREGLFRGRLETLELALQFKFGADGVALMPAFRAVKDPDHLQTIIQAVKAATSLDDVRNLVPMQPANGSDVS